jgi:hypothetical protein
LPNYSQPLSNGQPQVVTVADPAAGTNWSYLLPNNYTYQVEYIRYRLATDATAANRVHAISFTDIGNLYLQATPNLAQTASQTIDVTWSNSPTNSLNATNGLGNLTMPTTPILPGNHTIRSAILNLQATDQISDIDIYLRKWVNQNV